METDGVHYSRYSEHLSLIKPFTSLLLCYILKLKNSKEGGEKMGILSEEQAKEIKIKALDLMAIMKPKKDQRSSKRIYIRPRKQEKKFSKVKVLNSDRMVFCKICFKKVVANEAIEVIGGSEQGHKSFWMCREHM